MDALINNRISLLNLLKDSLRRPTDLNFLATHCLKISKSYLQTKHDNLTRIYYSEQYSIDEIALDSIVPLFQKDRDSDDYVLIKAYKNWRNPIETEADAEYFVHKIVWVQTEQHITHLYKEIDPFFAKILDSIKYLIRKKGFNKISYYGTVIIIMDDFISAGSKIIDKENFDHIPFEIFSGEKETLLEQIFSYLKIETEFYPAIPVNLLVKKLKLLRINDFLKSSNVSFSDDYEESSIVTKIISESLSKAFVKLDTFYFGKEKFSYTECEIFKEILTEIADDLKNGGMNKTLFEYYLEKDSSINSVKFYDDYHSTLNYLIKELKKSITKQLLKEN